jgi:recyclin-1
MFLRRRGSELDFDAMDEFMSHVLSALDEHGSRAVRVFPPPSQVLTSFADRVAVEVVRHFFFRIIPSYFPISFHTLGL